MPVLGSTAPDGLELVDRIGRGGNSVVWTARQLSTGRAVALKVLDVDVSDASALRRFDREREAMAALAAHPNILTIHDAGLHEGQPWIAMELCARGSLSRHVATAGPVESATAAAVLAGVADGLATAHERGVLHCDVKPANLMLTDHGVPAVGDFGIARARAGATTTSSRAYTLDYVAPELLDEQRPTVATDVYSLGVTVWELLAGRPPFSGDDDASPAVVMRRILTRPLPELPAGTDPNLVELLAWMTAKDPAERPADMAVVARRARELQHRSVDAVPGSPPFLALPAQDVFAGGPVAPAVGAPGVEPSTGRETWIRSRRVLPDPPPSEPLPRRRAPSRLAFASAGAALVLVACGAVAYQVAGPGFVPLMTTESVEVSSPGPTSSAPLASPAPIAPIPIVATSAPAAPAPEQVVAAAAPATRPPVTRTAPQPVTAVAEAPPHPSAPQRSAPVPAPAPQPEVRSPGVPTDTEYVVGFGGKCLDVRGPSTADGTDVQIWTCNGAPEMKWTLTSAGEIRGFGGKCLDVEGPSTADGTPVQIWTCNGAPQMRWTRTAAGEIRGFGGKCLDVRGPSTADGTSVQLWRCNGAPEMQWERRSP